MADPDTTIDIEMSGRGSETIGLTSNVDVKSVKKESARKTASALDYSESKPNENTYSKTSASSRPSMQDLRKAKNIGRLSELFGATDTNIEGGATPAGGMAIVVEDELARQKEEELAYSKKFGMWDGVFARCLLNIFGVIMFLRLGWMVAYAGIGMSIAVMLVSVALTTITTLSLSAICTNGQVEGGGAYYLISRSLGPEFGGAIGLMFFVANAVAIALYLVGFAETIVAQMGTAVLVSAAWDLRIIALASLVFLLLLCFVGVGWVIKFQLMLLGLLVVSIGSIFIGCMMAPSFFNFGAFVGFGWRNFLPDWAGDTAAVLLANQTYNSAAAVLASQNGGAQSFGTVLAVFFPAVTGIMAGANISGDLKRPGVAIPKGTLLAIGVSTVVYLLLAVFIGLTCLRSVDLQQNGQYDGLFHDTIIMAKISLWGPVVYAGIYAATLSSGLASLVGAPRILQAVARDALFPGMKFLTKGYNGDEPYPAYVFTFIIAVGCILIGDLNAIAPLITNFFMASYAMVNWACFAASTSKAPGWRPTFKYYNRWLALVGTIFSAALMMFLDTVMGFATLVIGVMLYKFVEYSKPEVSWGSASEGQRYLDALNAAVALDNTQVHVKNWRPQYLVLTGDPSERSSMAIFAGNLKKGHGVAVFGNVLVGGTLEKVERDQAAEEMKEFLVQRKIKGVVEVTASDSLRSGVDGLLQLSGMGQMRPNTVIMGYQKNWYQEGPEKVSEYVSIIGDSFDAGCGMVILRGAASLGGHVGGGEQKSESPPPVRGRRRSLASKGLEGADSGRIDVWWLADDGGLTLLLPHLLKKCKAWRKCDLRVMVIVSSEQEVIPEVARMQLLVKKFRIQATVEPVINSTPYQPSPASLERYKGFGVDALGPEGGAGGDDDTQPKFRDQTLNYIRMGELVREQSVDARLVAISLPVPRLSAPNDVYMSWLETLSDVGCPTVLMRGNQEDVLTFYS